MSIDEKRNRLTPNEIVIMSDYAIVKHCDKWGIPKSQTKIDIEDIELIRSHKWFMTNRGYACAKMNNKNSYPMHRLIMNAPKGMMVDHINGDRNDNRKVNLRLCNKSQNAMNHKLYNCNKSGVTGVYRSSKMPTKWEAQIKVNGKHIYLGSFEDINEAIKARTEAETKYFDEFSPLYGKEETHVN